MTTDDPPPRARASSAAQLADADVILLAPCGFSIARTAAELAAIGLRERPEWRALPAVRAGRVWVADGNYFLNRSSPRVVEAAELLAEVGRVGSGRVGSGGVASSRVVLRRSVDRSVGRSAARSVAWWPGDAAVRRTARGRTRIGGPAAERPRGSNPSSHGRSHAPHEAAPRRHLGGTSAGPRLSLTRAPWGYLPA